MRAHLTGKGFDCPLTEQLAVRLGGVLEDLGTKLNIL